MENRNVKSVLLEDIPLGYKKDGGNIKFSDTVRIGRGQRIIII